jgi:hypothetical protein
LVGDGLADTLEALRHMKKPRDTVGGKIWELLQLQVYDQAVQAGVRLLAEAPWAAAAVEEGHDVAAPRVL